MARKHQCAASYRPSDLLRHGWLRIISAPVAQFSEAVPRVAEGCRRPGASENDSSHHRPWLDARDRGGGGTNDPNPATRGIDGEGRQQGVTEWLKAPSSGSTRR